MCDLRALSIPGLRFAAALGLSLLVWGGPALAQPSAMAQAQATGVRMSTPVPDDVDQSGPFGAWLTGFKVEARSKGISQATLDRALGAVALNQRVIELNENQPEFNSAIWNYMDGAASEQRVLQGRKLLRKYRINLRHAERAYGVPDSVITAIWGLESNFGTNLGGFRVVEALATLGFEGRRAAFGREQLIAALKILEEGDITPERMIGSWAGAMGQTQFIPTVFLQYAQDGDRDGRRNLWDTRADVFASTANYLKEKGWQRDAPCFDEVRLPQGFDHGTADISIEKTVREWSDNAVTLVDGRPLARRPGQDMDAPAAIVLPAGHRGPAFIAYPNFKVVLAYNNAISYALAICELSVRFKGGPTFRTPWPRDELPLLARADRIELQMLLAQRRYDVGEPDGVIGRRTREAVRAFQRTQGLPPDGFPTLPLLARLRQTPI